MATFSQDLICTVLPNGWATETGANGAAQKYLNFSIIISPRLKSTGSMPTQLSSYPDWAAGTHTWPDTIAAALSSFRLGLRLPGMHTLAVKLVGAHQPDADAFRTVLPAATTVNPYVYEGFENRKIRSAPVASAVDLIEELYGRFGASSPTAFPTYAALAPVTSFGPLGFEQQSAPRAEAGGDPGIPGDGSVRKQTLVQALENALLAHQAIPTDLSHLAPSVPGSVASLTFLQHQRFLQRNLAQTSTPIVRPAPPDWDFHQMVGAMSSMPALMRVLGLVLDFHAGPVTTLTGAGTAAFEVIGSPFHAGTNVVLPAVQCQVSSNGIFRAVPAAGSDHTARMLRVGDTSKYRVIRVDHDGAALKTMQFADTVTRSRRNGKKQTLTTPARYALPALRTGGFAVARTGRAVQMAATLKRQTDVLQNGFFNPGTVPPVLHEDDITRGYRFDVFDRSDQVWRSLMWRQGTITVDGVVPITVLEEDTVVPAPTTATLSDPDLYLQETLTRWDGWSLAVPRLGAAFNADPSVAPTQGSNGFHVTTDWHVPGSSRSGTAETTTGNAHRLPRLRFGDSYQIRARAVDLAGNSLSVSQASSLAATGIVSAPLQHLRFEPLPAPRALHVGLPTAKPVLRPGESEEVVVIRSESATVDATSALDNATTARLLVPAPTSVVLAEQHRAYDLTTAGLAMNQAASLFKAVADHDAADVSDGQKVYFPAEEHSTANPYYYPPFLKINYLPEYVGRAALVRGLPINAFKKTVAELPFDTAHKGWLNRQAARVVLARGAAPNWTTRTVTDPTDSANVTTELDLVLGKGDMFTALVNSAIDKKTAEVMAIWEWIRVWCAEHHVSSTPAWNAILAGEHWMLTPWRRVTFVHAVRTPLKKPRLFLKPQRTAIGQTNAVFDGSVHFAQGSVLMSRKSTARIDLDGTWAMPIDDGTNADPVTPQHFSGHAFTLDLTRTGTGVDPTVPGTSAVRIHDADNFVEAHEFNDTKFRAVTYEATATSYYVEYFRQQLTVPHTGNPVTVLRSAPVTPGVAFEGSTVKITLRWTEAGTDMTRTLVAAPVGTAHDVAAPTPGDFVVVEDPTLATDPAHATKGTVQLLAHSNVPAVPDSATIEFSYVGPTIHTYSSPTADKTTSRYMHVLNSKRPDAPSVRYVVPIYSRTATSTGVTHKGGALRVYLDRPWWSSGDAERLGVICWHPSKHAGRLPAASIAPYVTLWGFDPVYKSTAALPNQPTPSCFALMTAHSSTGSLTIDESSDHVDVAGHSVGYDATRQLWYCDIRVTGPAGKELKSYSPFIRFAFARYQPHSIANAQLSKVVVVDYAQLSPNRYVTVTGSGNSARTVTVAGRAPVSTHHAPGGRSHLIVTVEARDPRITDDALAWSPVSGLGSLALASSVSDTDYVTWRGTVRLPGGDTSQLRLTFEEHERIAGGTGLGRLAFTESIPLGLPAS